MIRPCPQCPETLIEGHLQHSVSLLVVHDVDQEMDADPNVTNTTSSTAEGKGIHFIQFPIERKCLKLTFLNV